MKKILDATCGSRMMWFDKNNPDVIFGDIRQEKHTLCDGRVLEINPDMVIDFTNLPFEMKVLDWLFLILRTLKN